MSAATIIFACVAVIAVLEVSNLITGKGFLNKPVSIGIILLCLGLIVYFNIERGNVSGNETTKEKADSLENEVKILHSQIDSFNVAVNQKSDSNKKNEVIIAHQKAVIRSTEDTSTVFNKKGVKLTDQLKAEFHRDVQIYFSKYNLPLNNPVDIICRTGDDASYDFAEKLRDYLKSSGYTIDPIVNKMQLRSKKVTSLNMNSKTNRVEINIGAGDITPANPIVVQ